MVLQLFDPTSFTHTYIVFDAATRDAAIIDPVLGQSARDLAELQRHRLNLKWILDTHVHADHETGANALKVATGATTAVGADCESSGHDRGLVDGDTLALGGTSLRVMTTPGHTPGSVSYVWDGHVFTGDALLIEGCGRTDFQNGSSEALFHSITEKLFHLPDETTVFPGHDYQGRASSTIGHEKTANPRVAGKDLLAFRTLMDNLRLAPPRVIEQVVPANKRAGALETGQEAVPTVHVSVLNEQFSPQLDAIVDLRNAADFAVATLPHAQNVPTADAAVLGDLAKKYRHLYLLCRSGRRSLVAADSLRKSGVTNVWNVAGGMLAMNSPDGSERASVPHG